MSVHRNRSLSACIVGITVAVSLLTVSCAPPPTDDPSVLVASVRQTDEWVRNFNPLSVRGDLLWPSRGGVYEPLLIYNVMTSEYEPWLATGYEWDETDQVVTFELRPEVRWSDGAPFGPEDVVFTFDLLKRHPALDHKAVWSFLREVRVDGDHAVAFVFEHTMVPALEHIAHQPIVPQHVWSSIDDPVAFLNPDPVATGIFTEVVHFDGSTYDLGRNPYYWQATDDPVDILRVPAYANNTEVIPAILSGEVDWSGNFIPNADETYIAADPQHRIFWSPLIDGPIFLLPNTAKPPFDDVRVRKALSLAIDRDRLAGEALMGTSKPADGTFLDDGKRQYRNDDAAALDDWTTFDPARAEKLLDEAGYPRAEDGLRGSTTDEPWSFEILVTSGWSDWVRMAEIITENLAAIGVTVKPGLVTYDQWQHRGQGGDFDLALGMTESRLTPYAMYRSMISAATVSPIGEQSLANWHRFSDEEGDSFLLAYEMTSEEDLQEEILRRVQLRVVETAPAIPLVLGPSWGAANSARIDGFPSAENPYARLSPNSEPDCLLVLTKLHPR